MFVLPRGQYRSAAMPQPSERRALRPRPVQAQCSGMTTITDVRQPTLTELAAAVDAAADPLDRLDALRVLNDAVSVVRQEAVAAARGQHATWTDVGARLHVSKQTVARRFGQVRDVAPANAAPANHNAEGTTRTRKQTGWDVTTPRGRTLLRVLTRR
jgi:hypothetical protein